jgi:hypothetical protein
MKEILEKAPLFEVGLSRSTPESCKDGSYLPDFSSYDVIVINEGFGANNWPEATQKAFEKYIAEGGGQFHDDIPTRNRVGCYRQSHHPSPGEFPRPREEIAASYRRTPVVKSSSSW